MLLIIPDAATVGNAFMIDCFANAPTATIPANTTAVFVCGFYTPGDLGQALYKKVNSQPSTTGGKFENNGIWYQLAEPVINPFMFGARGDGTTNGDNVFFQNAIDFIPRGGGLMVPTGYKYLFNDEVRINKPFTVYGQNQGSFVNDSDGYIEQTNIAKNAFTLVATLTNYAFGAYGIIGNKFSDIAIRGSSSGSRSLAAIGVDTSVNGGDFHIRECTFSNVDIRYFQKGYALTGIAYLNKWNDGCVFLCDTGLSLARGASSDVGGQNRAFGLTLDICLTCASIFMDTIGGGFSFFGCTLSESLMGLEANEEVILDVIGCEFEALVNAGNGAGIYIPMTEANSNTQGTKTIIGNKFLSSDNDIWIDKQSTTSDGNFYWPMLIDSNYFGSASALKLTVPAGHVLGFNSQAFVFGSANSGSVNGVFDPAQISPNYRGNDLRKRTFSARITFDGTYSSGSLMYAIPFGAVITSVRCYLTAHSSVFSAYEIGDQTSAARYLGFDGSSVALNTWQNATIAVPEVIIDGTDNKLALTGTGGINGGAGVIEIQGYISNPSI